MADYDFYQGVYRGGTLSREQWEVFGLRAQAQMDYFERIYQVAGSDGDKAMAVCAMAEALQGFDDGGGAVRSAAIGSVSVRYDSGADLSPKGQERELMRILRRYTTVYRGVSE